MIIKENTNSATTVGDIKSNEVTIDPRNIQFITQLLSTNLYSEPISSFIRETVTNAWDSHIEAGNKEPILVELGQDTENRIFCRVQDFGVGLSPERFNEVYRMLGSSTKRDTNEQHGGWGIGKFSALAYTNTVYLTSNYMGTKYKYLMYKDGNAIKMDELSESATTDPNGLEVLVYLKEPQYTWQKDKEVANFIDAIYDQLLYFENIYVSGNTLSSNFTYQIDRINKFNNLKIKKYKNFSVNTAKPDSSPSICLGKVMYPLNFNAITESLESKYHISINFDIGDLVVTPNREQIQYTKETIKIIDNKIREVKKELEELSTIDKVLDYQDFKEYVAALGSESRQINLYQDSDTIIGFKVKTNHKDISYKGNIYNDTLARLWDKIQYLGVKDSNISFYLSDNRIFSKDTYIYNFKSLIDRISNNKLYFGNLSDLNNYSKAYLREKNYNGCYFLHNITYIKFIKALISRLKTDTNKYNKKDLKVILEYLFEQFKLIPTFTNATVPDSYIQNLKALQKTSKIANGVNSINWNEEVNLFVLDFSTQYGVGAIGRPRRYSLKELKSFFKGTVVYAEKDNNRLRRAFEFIHKSNIRSNLKFVEIAPTKMKILEAFPNFIHIDKFMTTDLKILRKIATAQLINEEHPEYFKLHALGSNINLISKNLYNLINKLHKYQEGYSIASYYYGIDKEAFLDDVKELCKKHNYYDLELLGEIKKHKKLLDGAQIMYILTNGSYIHDTQVNIMTDYMLSRKIFKPDLEAVKKLKKETIYNLKIEDENT